MLSNHAWTTSPSGLNRKRFVHYCVFYHLLHLFIHPFIHISLGFFLKRVFSLKFRSRWDSLDGESAPCNTTNYTGQHRLKVFVHASDEIPTHVPSAWSGEESISYCITNRFERHLCLQTRCRSIGIEAILQSWTIQESGVAFQQGQEKGFFFFVGQNCLVCTYCLNDCFLADKEAVWNAHHSPKSGAETKYAGDNSWTSSS
jgi:hypothetical protein